MENFTFDLNLSEPTAIMLCTVMVGACYRTDIDEESAGIMFDNAKRLYKMLPPDAQASIKQIENSILKDETMMEKQRQFEQQVLEKYNDDKNSL